jgi:fatty-acyl-CoA synthase
MSVRMTVGNHVSHNASRFPSKIALIDPYTRITYAQLDKRTNRVANILAGRGISHGDKVAILSLSSVEWVVVYIAIVKLGAIAVPLNYRLAGPDIRTTIEDSQSKLLVVSSSFRDTFLADLPSIPQVCIDEFDQKLGEFSDAAPNASVVAGDVNVILYTGGTTGQAKGVMLTHENLFWNSLDEIIDTHMCEGDNTLLATPLHHSAALNCWLLPHLYLGATATLLPKFSPGEMLKLIEGERVTNAFTPPSMARDVFTNPAVKTTDLSSFRRWYIGGGILPRQDRDTIHALIPGVRIYYQYGLTEAGPIVTVLKEEDYEKAPGSIGRAFINIEARIQDLEGNTLPPGNVGEIAVRGPTVMKGYYNRPEATKDVLAPDGWLRTGDLGSMDDHGFITFHDRAKDLIKTGGLNVYSQEVEQVLAKHSAIGEVAVIGIPSRDWDEEVTAVVVLRDDQQASERDIIAFARERLSGFKTPKRVVFLAQEEIPINYSGKILKKNLRKTILDRLAEEQQK